jgi:F-type H+-transporting ATPase subunit alpha
VLKQDQYVPLSVERQVLLIFAATNKFLDDLEISECRPFEAGLYDFIDTSYPGIFKTLREKKAFDDALKAETSKALEAYKERFIAATRQAAPASAGAAVAK